MGVLILVFVELALGDQKQNSVKLNYKWFQSLFLWNSPSEFLPVREFHTYYEVSILVFVELALGDSSSARSEDLPVGFNPCFCGTRPRSHTYKIDASQHIGFQSLFLWNSPSERPRVGWDPVKK